MTERYHFYHSLQLSMDQLHPEFIRRGEATTKIWSNWFQGPLKDATIPLSVHIGAANMDADLKFYFRQVPEGPPSLRNNGDGGNAGGQQWWSLCVDLKSCSKAIIQFLVKIDSVDQGRNLIAGDGNSIRKLLTFPEGTESQDPMLKLKEKFVQRERDED